MNEKKHKHVYRRGNTQRNMFGVWKTYDLL